MIETPSGSAAGPLWHLIALSSYQRPPQPTSEAVRQRIRGFADHLRRPITARVFRPEANLVEVPDALLDQIAAQPDPAMLLPAVGQMLEGWLASPNPVAPVQLAVSAPFSWLPEALALWARERGFWQVQPPTPQEILDGGHTWLQQFDRRPDGPLLIPNLERLYLRHQAGLSLLQRLVEWLSIQQQHCLINCDSWAWAYLCKVIQIDRILPEPFTLAPCDEPFLTRWLQAPAAGQGQPDFVFRQANNGRYVLAPIVSGAHELSRETTDFLRHLAAYSRGIPGVAWTLWRSSLQYGDEQNLTEKALESAREDRNRTIWVQPWSELDLPRITTSDQSRIIILHALLLHGGMTTHTLAGLLPLSTSEVTNQLQRLKNTGILNQTGLHWQVRPGAYPAVRELLARDGYLLDVM